MKRALLALLAALLLVVPAQAQHGRGGAPVDDSKVSKGGRIVEKMKFPPLTWSVPQVGREVERLTLSNGIVVYLLRDDTLPRVQASLVVRGGSLLEPLEKHGLADLTADLQRTGGTAAFTPEELDRRLEVKAIDLEAGISSETSYVRLDVLRDELPAGLELLAEVALRPRFDPKRIEVTREQIHESLRRQNDRPGQIAGREFPYLVYGDHPFGRKYRWPTVQGITRQDLQDWHARLWTPDRAFLAVAGDFQRDALVADLERVFGGWKPNGVALPDMPTPPQDPAGGVFVVERKLNQSSVMLGHLGVDRQDPDRESLQVLNYILGGGSFSSRLMEQVRNRAGLAYSVSSSLDVASAQRGLFLASFQTRADATRRAIDLVLAEIRGIREKPVTAAELRQAKESLVNGMVFQFDQPFEIVRRLMTLEIQGLPADYYESWARRVAAVTAADVQRVAQRVLQPDRLVLLVVGEPKSFDRPLDDLGPVKTVQLEVVP